MSKFDVIHAWMCEYCKRVNKQSVADATDTGDYLVFNCEQCGKQHRVRKGRYTFFEKRPKKR